MKDKFTKRCKRCSNYLLGLERKGDVCNKCLSCDDSGQLTSFALPMAVAAIAMYLMHFMAAHGILQSLTMIGGAK